ncbi:MAG TPA: RNA polymerase factor sigma-54 [Fimbriimonadaceae bacterium]|nr:RNA polymerase factor sigma-54 [Fimbriimonadaceae bacterium]
MQGFRQTQRQQTSVGLRLDPRVLVSSKLLELTQQELDEAISAEIADNPALERLADDTEPLTEAAILKSVAPHELSPKTDDWEVVRSRVPDEDGADWLDFAGSTPCLRDHLRAQIRVRKELQLLAEYVIESLSDRGFLTMHVEELALETNHSMEEVEEVILALQTCEPAGVGASDVKECLLLQLKRTKTVEAALARKIVTHHLEEFRQRKTMRLARRYKVMPEVVEAAFALILSLTPFPAEDFDSSHEVPQSVSVKPDIIYTYDPAGWKIEVTGAQAAFLRVERSYRQRLEQIRASAKPQADERKHLQEFVDRAETFITALEMRQRTLSRIAEYLLVTQSGFIQTAGYEFIRPLTRAQMSKDLGLHESTISRATAAKYVQLANGEVVPFDLFFKPALRIQKMIEDMLREEDPNEPMSDEQIAVRLAKKGVFIARRTVNKYRDKNRLLSSRGRRSA